MFFTSYISGILLQKNVSIQQFTFYEMAKVRVLTEKQVISIIMNHDIFPDFEEIVLHNQRVFITYDELINVRICGEFCYTMIIHIDPSINRILSITYE